MSSEEQSKTDDGQSRLNVGLGTDFTPDWANYRQGFKDGLAESSGHIYEAEADQIRRPLCDLLRRALPMLSGAGCGTLAAEICVAIGVTPN